MGRIDGVPPILKPNFQKVAQSAGFKIEQCAGYGSVRKLQQSTLLTVTIEGSRFLAKSCQNMSVYELATEVKTVPTIMKNPCTSSKRLFLKAQTVRGAAHAHAMCIENTWTASILRTPGPSTPSSIKIEASDNKDSEWEMLSQRANEVVKKRQPDLIVDFEEHLAKTTNIEALCVEKDVLSNPESAQKIVNRLQAGRSEKQWRVEIMGKNVSLLSAGSVQQEAMLKGFGSVCDIQMYWRSDKEKIAKSSSGGRGAGLPGALSKLLSQVFEYQARFICHLSKSQLSRAWEKAVGSNNWASLQSLAMTSHEACKGCVIRGQDEAVQANMALQLDHMERSCQIEEKILNTLREAEQEKWQSDLLHNLVSEAPTYERDKNFNKDRVKGACEWVFKDLTFCKWRDNTSSSLIWTSAGPGCGESVLSRALLDERHLANSNVVEVTSSNVISRTVSSYVCYFFFKDADALRIKATNALCAILHQLFCSASGKLLIGHAESSHRKYGKSLKTNFSELWRIFKACAESPCVHGIVCVLDAMHEGGMESRNELFQHLRRFCNNEDELKSSKIKFLLTGRPYDDLENELRPLETQSHAAYIRYDGDDKFEEIGQDIDLVVDAKMENLGRHITNEDDRSRIRQRLKGMDNCT
ncbi:uncharacterized protein MAM_03568 [Metarhizium album ARSEF 1941]|uniref:Nephrocystin 3-like N-terminal domain-containing protein n=1 Tax=Metarhizium album (strain ARSEF 1941) TaxID=1081103 RepID=A0A0B2WXX3_METAS|nr:uncharacterized protein MAM_03568 [Metarhizium album ARSEF 1941]KHN98444.1 hypothetical protein MAM_03568 [Metarhizium album ARSEF 1941]